MKDSNCLYQELKDSNCRLDVLKLLIKRTQIVDIEDFDFYKKDSNYDNQCKGLQSKICRTQTIE